MACSNASADTLLGIYAGAQAWNMDAEGSFGSPNSSAEFNFEDENQGSFYIALEHPVPIIPNIKVKHNQMDTDGNATLDGTFEFGGVNYSVNSTLATDVDLSNTDIVLYYEILDNDLVTLDLGINVKRVDGELDVVNINDTTQTSREDFEGYIPLAYGNIEIGLPFTGLGIFAEGSFLSVGGHTLYDYEVGIGYTFIDNMAVDMTLQVGYRSFQLELDDLDDIDTDLDFDGAFVGLEIHF